MIEIFILSLIQGFTEFLPVSSSSHLILVSKYLSFNNQNLSIDVSLHIGSFLAVITYFRKDIFNFFKNK
jgi:undecaprenyl-diphosphatase